MRRRVLLLTFLVILVLVYALGAGEFLSFDYLKSHLQFLQGIVNENGVLALLVFAVLYTLVVALSIPGAGPLSLLGGALFGVAVGVAVVSSAATLGATAAFLFSRHLFRDWVNLRYGARFVRLNRLMGEEGAYYLFAARLNPVVPFFLINLAMGLSPMRMWTYSWVSFVGMLPGTLLYVNAGRQLSQLESASGLLSPTVLGSLVLVGIFPWVVRRLGIALDRARGGSHPDAPKRS